MNSLVNGSNDNAVTTNGAHIVNGAQLTTPSRMGLLNNTAVKDGITHKVLLLKPSKVVENGQRLNLVTLAITPSISPSVNVKNTNTINNNKSKNVHLNNTQLDEMSSKTTLVANTVVKKQAKVNAKNDTMKVKTESKKCVSTKEGNYKSQQSSLETQTQSLMKRIKRLQAKQMQKHVGKQLKAFVKCKQSVDGVCCQYLIESKKDDKPNCSSCTSVKKQRSSAEDKIKLFSAEGVKNLSTSALVNLVKRLEKSSVASPVATLSSTSSQFSKLQEQQTSSVIQNPSTTEAAGCDESNLAKLLQQKSDSESNAINVNTNNSFIKREEVEELNVACGTLKSNLQHLEQSYDSDATESSSGGESCDEFDDICTNKPLLTGSNATIPIDKRASWKWFVDRGAIASRWTWLQAQVADLEFKIRQQNEMYRQLRANKGTITFFCRENVPNSVGVSPDDLSKSTAEATERTIPSAASEDETSHCVRTLPLKQMRKRKLVRAANALSQATRKIARHSTVQCICNSSPHFVSPCVLCNGRFGYVQVIDTDCMPHYERIALLDSSCHSVLSLPNDVALGLHFSKLLKKETVQQPVTARPQYKKRKGSQPSDFNFKFGVDGRKGRKSQAVISSSKLRKKYDGTVKRKYSKNSCGDQGFPKRPKFGDGHEHSNGSGDSRYDSPLSSPFTADIGNSAPLNRRRRSEQHAFDINNIVIPYSIASSTRVEKLQYKEILTPKWRTFDHSSDKMNEIVPSEITEDLSDDAFADRHERCEAEERKRFGCVLKAGSGRGRWARARLDSSRSDCNTNCVNNATGDSNIDSSSQDSFASNPASLCTSAALASTGQEQKVSQEVIHGTPARTTERHRTSSSSKRDDSVDDDTYVEVPPYDKRRFPLSDSDYQELLQVELCNSESDDCVVNEVKEEEKSEPIAEPTGRETPRSASSSDVADNGAETDDNAGDPEWEPKVE